MTPQAAVQSRAGYGRMKELPRDRQKIVQGQQQGGPKIHHDGFLSRRQGRRQGMRSVRGIFDRIAAFPFTRHGAGNAVFFSQGPLTQLGVSNLLPNRRGGTGVLMKANLHRDESQPDESKTSRRMLRASNRA